MDAQDLDQDVDFELEQELLDDTPPEAFYLALKNALAQLKHHPTEAHVS